MARKNSEDEEGEDLDIDQPARSLTTHMHRHRLSLLSRSRSGQSCFMSVLTSSRPCSPRCVYSCGISISRSLELSNA
eukprot:scaffold4602_cov181-Pinguiococcus_pyrenoidosus.AAC.1